MGRRVTDVNLTGYSVGEVLRKLGQELGRVVREPQDNLQDLGRTVKKVVFDPAYAHGQAALPAWLFIHYRAKDGCDRTAEVELTDVGYVFRW